MSETLQMALNRIKPPSEEWRNGPKITAEDLKNNTGNVEYISSIHDDVPIVNNKKQTTLNFKSQKPKPAKSNSSPIMNFGKYRDKTITWVMDNDSNYFEWCLENVPSFQKRVDSL